jgi:outer membrane protein assembly factor BamD
MVRSRVLRRVALALVTAGALAAIPACGGRRSALPAAGSIDADKFLFDRGTAALKEKHWIEAREYFRRLVDTYPTSRFRQDAKLGIGDSYLGENRLESNVLAANEYREFLSFFPLNPRADYAQFKLADALYRQVLAPQRDQTATYEALREMDAFLKSYPSSALRPDVEKLRRQARDRLGEHEFSAGMTYFRNRWMPGAIGRFKYLLDNYPDYTHKDAVYYYLAESLFRLDPAALAPEARSYYELIVTEFSKSEYLERAKKRILEIKR